MRALLISDTHGNLDIINHLIDKTKADLVIHAGDFGFYDESSYQHLSSRELLLLITHSPYRKEYSLDKQTDKNTLIEIVSGNFLVSQKMLKQPIAGNAGKVWATLHQFGVLYQKLQGKTKPSIFVSHVSPGKEPLLTRLMIHFMPKFWISGHMGGCPIALVSYCGHIN
ncbi:MAG: metallophosphoesterase [Candidatus Berkiellales bacterium]